MQNRPRSVSITLIFIAFNALIWLALGVLIALHAHPALPDSPLVQGLMSFLSFAMAGILSGLFFLLVKQIRIAYFLTFGLFVIITIAFVFDEFGWIDLLGLLISLVPIALLIKDRAWYLQH